MSQPEATVKKKLYDDLLAQNKKLTESLANSNKSVKETIDALKLKQLELIRKNNELENENAKKDAAFTEANTRAEAEKAESFKLRTDISDLKTQLKTSEKDKEIAKKTADDRIGKLTETIKSLTTEKSNVTKQIDELTIKYNNLTKEHKNVSDEHTALKDKHKTLESTVKSERKSQADKQQTLKTEKEAIQKELDSLRMENTKISSDLTAKTQELQKLQKEFKLLEKKLADETEAYNKKLIEQEEKLRAIMDSKDSKHLEETAALSAQYASAVNEHSEYVAKVASDLHEWAAATNIRIELQRQLTELKRSFNFRIEEEVAKRLGALKTKPAFPHKVDPKIDAKHDKDNLANNATNSPGGNASATTANNQNSHRKTGSKSLSSSTPSLGAIASSPSIDSDSHSPDGYMTPANGSAILNQYGNAISDAAQQNGQFQPKSNGANHDANPADEPSQAAEASGAKQGRPK